MTNILNLPDYKVLHVSELEHDYQVHAEVAEPPTHCLRCNHSFRATGITNYMQNGGRIDVAQEWASHSDPRTTSLYERSEDKVSVEEVERIRFERGE